MVDSRDMLDGFGSDEENSGPIPTLIENVFKVDGPEGLEYQIGQEEQPLIESLEQDFYRNLAEEMDEYELDSIASELLEGIDDDIESRKDWEESYTKGMKYLGRKVEDAKDWPFMHSCAAFDPTLATAHLRFYSSARAELFPANGPASYQTFGEKTEELQNKGQKLMKWMNHYLTNVDREYYPDSERLLTYLGIVGCACRKVYTDPITKYPVARFIDPQDFIVNNNCTSILSSDRLTHRERLTRKTLKLRQLNGFYRKIPTGVVSEFSEDDDSTTSHVVKRIEGVTTNDMQNKSLYIVYEVHADLNLNGFDGENLIMESETTGVPLPYIVSICLQTRKILSLRRNWVKDDNTFARSESFVLYNYLPGFGIYGVGLSQLLGSNAIVLTSIIRQLIDAGTLRNFPGGLMAKGLKVEENDKAIGPSEFWRIETGGKPIQDVVMTMPYGEPSMVLKELRTELVEQTQVLASTAETQISDAKAEAPVGTTLALLEVQNRIQSSILRSLHVSLSNELDLLFKLFSEGMVGQSSFMELGAGGKYEISREDFDSNIKIVPISDPNLTTSTQRILRAEGILRLAQSEPSLHNMRNAYYRMYTAMNVEDIDLLLPPPQEVYPLDPISENMHALENKPLKAALWQDHESHIIVHELMLQQNPDASQSLLAHINEHRAQQYYLIMEQQLGVQLPPLEQMMEPQIQNMVAMEAAKATMELKSQIIAQQPKQVDPQAVMLADIDQRREAESMKLEIAKMKTELEAFKAQLKYESDIQKIESQEKIADVKSETDMVMTEAKLKVDLSKDKNSSRGEQI